MSINRNQHKGVIIITSEYITPGFTVYYTKSKLNWHRLLFVCFLYFIFAKHAYMFIFVQAMHNLLLNYTLLTFSCTQSHYQNLTESNCFLFRFHSTVFLLNTHVHCSIHAQNTKLNLLWFVSSFLFIFSYLKASK